MGPGFLPRYPARVEGQRARKAHFVRGALFVFGPSNPKSKGCLLRQAITFRSPRHYGKKKSMKENWNKRDKKDKKSKGNKKNKKNKKSKNMMDKKVKTSPTTCLPSTPLALVRRATRRTSGARNVRKTDTFQMTSASGSGRGESARPSS